MENEIAERSGERHLLPSFMSQRKFDMNPPCTRFRQSAKRLVSDGGEQRE
jgi:hypothetical protein